MSVDYRDLLSGRRRDPLSFVARGVLQMGTLPYRVAVGVRNRRYDRGHSEVHRCGVPVISVGNLTTGGTGKTPVVCMLAKQLRQRGKRVALVSRGYGRGDNDANDEAMELHNRLPDVPHVQDPDRVAAARIAVEELEAEVVLMDDGFQHRRLHRDLDIVVIDATCPFGYGHVLPRGLLREPISSLRRADLVLISRADAVDRETLQQIQHTIRQHGRHDRSGSEPEGVPIATSVHRPAALLEYPEYEHALDELKGQPIAAISAIGNPEAFEETLRRCGATVVDSKRLADHDPFDRSTVEGLRDWIQGLGRSIERVICTHKDLVKLQTDRLGGQPLRALLIDLQIRDGQQAIDDAIQRLLQQ